MREAVGVVHLVDGWAVSAVSDPADCGFGAVGVFGGVCGGASAVVFGSARDRPELPASRDGMRRRFVSGIPTMRGHSTV